MVSARTSPKRRPRKWMMLGCNRRLFSLRCSHTIKVCSAPRLEQTPVSPQPDPFPPIVRSTGFANFTGALQRPFCWSVREAQPARVNEQIPAISRRLSLAKRANPHHLYPPKDSIRRPCQGPGLPPGRERGQGAQSLEATLFPGLRPGRAQVFGAELPRSSP